MMSNRPFARGSRPIPEINANFPSAIAALVPQCEAELAVIDSLSPLSLADMKETGGERTPKTNAIKIKYQEEGRYSDEFMERLNALSLHIYLIKKSISEFRQELRKTPGHTLSGDALEARREVVSWFETPRKNGDLDKLGRVNMKLEFLDPTNAKPPINSRDCAPDNISDALSQGIGVSEYL